MLNMYFSNILKLAEGLWEVEGLPKMTVDYPEDGHRNLMHIEESSFWFRIRSEIICALVKKYKMEQPIFDIGGGNGFVAKSLEREDIETVLIEPGPGAANAVKRGVQHVIRASFHELKSAKKMPSVSFFDVLEHIENDREFLEHLKNRMGFKSRGILTVPAFSFLWSGDDIFARHHRRYNVKTLHKALEASGFRPIYTSYFFSYLYVPVLLFRALPYRLGLEFSHTDEKAEKDHGDAGIFSGLVSKVLMFLGNLEKVYLLASGFIPFGSSIICVFEKNDL